MAKKDPVYRRINALGFILCLTAVIYAVLGLQDLMTHVSSPLTSLSKLLLISSALFFFLALIHNPDTLGQRCYALFNIALSIFGLGCAGHHLWVQEALDKSITLTQCGFPIEELLANQTGIINKLSSLWSAAAECPAEAVNFINLGVAEQSLIIFVILFFLSWKQLIRRKKAEGLFL